VFTNTTLKIKCESRYGLFINRRIIACKLGLLFIESGKNETAIWEPDFLVFYVRGQVDTMR
jgi:hypothetical protein